MTSSINLRAAQIILSGFIHIQIVPTLNIQENYMNSAEVWISTKIFLIISLSWKVSEYSHRCMCVISGVFLHPSGPTVTHIKQLYS